MRKLSLKSTAILLFIVVYTLAGPAAMAQCAMCRATTESNMKQKNNSNKVGIGLNTGILYLMSVPYLMGGLVGIVWWRKKKEIKAFLNSEPE